MYCSTYFIKFSNIRDYKNYLAIMVYTNYGKSHLFPVVTGPANLSCNNRNIINGTELINGLSQKNPNRGSWGHGIPAWSLKEEHAEFPGQLKKKWNFQGQSRKNHVEYPWVFVFGFEIPKGCNTILWNFYGWSLLYLEFPRLKWQT